MGFKHRGCVMRFRPIALLGMLLLAASSAAAEDIRFPATGMPAFTMHTPDSWTSQKDGEGNVLLTSSDHTIVVVLTLVAYSGPFDVLAAEALKVAKATPVGAAEPAAIDGLKGSAYHASMTNPGGVKLNLKLIAVQVDAVHTFTCTLISALPDGDSLLSPGNDVIASMKLVGR